jgi:hypothetical protein
MLHLLLPCLLLPCLLLHLLPRLPHWLVLLRWEMQALQPLLLPLHELHQHQP